MAASRHTMAARKRCSRSSASTWAGGRAKEEPAPWCSRVSLPHSHVRTAAGHAPAPRPATLSLCVQPPSPSPGMGYGSTQQPTCRMAAVVKPDGAHSAAALASSKAPSASPSSSRTPLQVLQARIDKVRWQSCRAATTHTAQGLLCLIVDQPSLLAITPQPSCLAATSPAPSTPAPAPSVGQQQVAAGGRLQLEANRVQGAGALQVSAAGSCIARQPQLRGLEQGFIHLFGGNQSEPFGGTRGNATRGARRAAFGACPQASSNTPHQSLLIHTSPPARSRLRAACRPRAAAC